VDELNEEEDQEKESSKGAPRREEEGIKDYWGALIDRTESPSARGEKKGVTNSSKKKAPRQQRKRKGKIEGSGACSSL